ncbi:MAG: metal ABC transporter substrate-binding protein [Magnetococcales bacterium]|nr:metal ABC transporter substrate-binding protein [Magnetococcales bacterium]
MMPILSFLALWLLLPTTTWADPPLRVVASFSILADMVHQVGGEAVTVKSLVGPNGDAHVYEPTPMDAQALLAADLFVINGLGFEGWIERLVKASGFKGQVVTVSEGIHRLPLTGTAQPDQADPHAWHEVANGRLYVTHITEALARLSPAQATTFRTNAAHYDAQLAELDLWVRAQFAAIPATRRTVITSHDAFGYFARAYGITFLAPMGVSTDAEPSARDLALLAMQAKREGIKAVFLENMSDPRLIQQLAREAGITVGGTLYPDALSAPDGPAPTYMALIRHNVRLLLQAMTGP